MTTETNAPYSSTRKDIYVNELEVFFKLLFGKATNGYLCIAVLNPDTKQMSHHWFSYPQELPQVVECAEEFGTTHNVYFCPQLFTKQSRNKEYVLCAPNVWADLDTCPPDKLLVKPSVLVESSPGRYHAYWILDDYEMAPTDVESIARRIAYHHANDGCDRSGWDLTQLLRVPNTYNLKYMQKKDVPVVKLVCVEKIYYRLKDFEEYPQLVDYKYVDEPFPEDLSDKSAEEILIAHKRTLSPLIWELFSTIPDLHEWSKALWNLETMLFEAGFTAEDVFIIAKEAQCNKYVRDGRPDKHLWKEVCRAAAHFKTSKEILVKKPESIVQLMTDEERKHVNTLQPTFVENYIDWASTLGDAAIQYHQAAAFTLLSALLCGTVKLPTSYGNVIPNLWFMILGDTTLTRKTTSMDIAMSLLEEIDSSAIMATDGSVEGIFTNLSLRPGKPSIFLRDEFSGLLQAMFKKDYMSDMPEMLTKLYDGKMQRRLLRKEIIEIVDPRLIIYAGGIKTKVTSLLRTEHVSSGFLPRFIFITAETDIKNIKPLGPPTHQNNGERNVILKELKKIYKHYTAVTTIKIEGIDGELNAPKDFNAVLTDDAWVRYNKLETALVDIGLKSHSPDLFTPVGDRLAKSILKAAVLIAASRQFNDGTNVVVTLDDILRAIKFGEMWRTYAQEVINSVSSSALELTLTAIFKTIKRAGSEGVNRSAIMRSHKMSSREANTIFDTLEDRNMIEKLRDGSNVKYFAKELLV